jgi:hypothetical protein
VKKCGEREAREKGTVNHLHILTLRWPSEAPRLADRHSRCAHEAKSDSKRRWGVQKQLRL